MISERGGPARRLPRGRAALGPALAGLLLVLLLALTASVRAEAASRHAGTKKTAGTPGGAKKTGTPGGTTKTAGTPGGTKKGLRPGFNPPFRIAGPVDADLIPVQLAYSSAGTAASAFGVYDEDDPGISHGSLAQAGATGSFGGARAVPGTQQVFGLTYRGANLELLAGTSPHVLEFGALEPCCSDAFSLLASPRGAVSRRHTLVTQLDGASEGQLVSVGTRLLAAVADEEGVWAAQSDTHGRFGPTRALDTTGAWVNSLASAGLTGGGTIVVWSAKASQFAPGPLTIFAARGTAARAPALATVAITVPPTHEIDSVAVAAHDRVPTVAWVESWYDAKGVRHSQVYAEDLAGAHRAHALSPATTLASDVTMAAGTNGAQVVAFQSCTRENACTLDAVTRHGAGFTRATVLGASDASEAPAVAESALGEAMVAWITPAGGVRAALAAPGRRFAQPVLVSSTAYAADLAAAFAPSGRTGLLAWTQGTFEQSLVASTYAAPASSTCPRSSSTTSGTTTSTKTSPGATTCRAGGSSSHRS